MYFASKKIIIGLSLLFGLITNIQASPANPCDDGDSAAGDISHCMYSTDKTHYVPADDGNGKSYGNYIKTTLISPAGKEVGTIIACASYGEDVARIYNQDLAEMLNKTYFEGKNTFSFSVCSDKKCSKEKFVGQDVFYITKTNSNSLTVTPKLYAFAFSGIYPEIDCNVANNDLSLRQAK